MCMFLYFLEMIVTHFALLGTVRYEAHLWDNSRRREVQARKGHQGFFFSLRVFLVDELI